MRIWNFKEQDLKEGVIPPACNGISGGNYEPVYIDFGENGETKIGYFDRRKENERTRHKKV